MKLDNINKPLFGDNKQQLNTPAEIALIATIALCLLAIVPNANSKTAMLALTTTLASSSVALVSISSYRANGQTNKLIFDIKSIYNSAASALNEASAAVSDKLKNFFG